MYVRFSLWPTVDSQDELNVFLLNGGTVKLSRMMRTVGAAGRGMTFSPLQSVRELSHVSEREQAARFASSWPEPHPDTPEPQSTGNPLRQYFDNVEQGPGIWKWLHYFDLYHHHLAKFVGKQINIVEVGVYSGGSMPMWRNYFGKGCQVHGVDIQPECRSYENDHIKIHIGDQANRNFWRQFRADVPEVDVLIDDGGHQPYQQIATLEEMLPHLRPGGVFICEDIHGIGDRFTAYCNSLIDSLNAVHRTADRKNIVCQSTGFQAWIRSITCYPYAVVIEKATAPMPTLSAPKHGTEWQPFL